MFIYMYCLLKMGYTQNQHVNLTEKEKAFIISSIQIKLDEKKIQAKKAKFRKWNEEGINANSFKHIKNLQ